MKVHSTLSGGRAALDMLDGLAQELAFPIENAQPSRTRLETGPQTGRRRRRATRQTTAARPSTAPDSTTKPILGVLVDPAGHQGEHRRRSRRQGRKRAGRVRMGCLTTARSFLRSRARSSLG